jgi:hypothetical protein
MLPLWSLLPTLAETVLIFETLLQRSLDLQFALRSLTLPLLVEGSKVVTDLSPLATTAQEALVHVPDVLLVRANTVLCSPTVLSSCCYHASACCAASSAAQCRMRGLQCPKLSCIIVLEMYTAVNI